MDPFAADVLYYSLLFGSFLFVIFFVKESVGNWKVYLQLKYQSEVDRALLEIRVPREMNKTPLAMELVLNGLTEPADGDWYTNMTTGKRKPIFSLEMASHGGEVHFYIWIPRDWVPRAEAHFYAQYPSIELVEVQDYAIRYPFSLDTHKLFGFEYELITDDPVPIMTYKKYGTDKQSGVEPEDQIDPITQTIEAMSNIGPGEEMWVQMVCSYHKGNGSTKVPWKERWKALFTFPFAGKIDKSIEKFFLFWNGKKTTDWKKDGQDLIKKIRESYKQKGEEGYSTNEMTKLDKLKMDAIAENITKPAFDVGIRTLYIAQKDQYKPNTRVNMMGSLFKQYAAGDVYNGLKPGLITNYSYPWMDRKGKHMKHLKEELAFAYKRRAFIYHHEEELKYKKKMFKTFVLSTEELATIYHLPGQVARTPSFERIESVTGQAPANLPL